MPEIKVDIMIPGTSTMDGHLHAYQNPALRYFPRFVALQTAREVCSMATAYQRALEDRQRRHELR